MDPEEMKVKSKSEKKNLSISFWRSNQHFYHRLILKKEEERK
jgi:hypothetical protein